MYRVLLALLIVVAWAGSSAYMMFLSIFSIDATIIISCAAFAIICLVGAFVLFGYRKDFAAVAVAVSPGILLTIFLQLVNILD